MDNCKEAVCIQTGQIYDSCRDKECLDSLRVYLCGPGQSLVDRAAQVKARAAELIWVFPTVEAVPFNKGFYTVDMQFFFKITLDVYTGVCTPTKVCGLATYDKKVVLYGSEGNSKVFTSQTGACDFNPADWQKANLPRAVVSAIDPIVLSEKLVAACDSCSRCCDCEVDMTSLPSSVKEIFDDALVLDGEQKRVFVSLGLFSIVKLERDVQILIPAYDFCIPDKKCTVSTEKNPCDIFEKLNFPVDEFFPPLRGEEEGCRNEDANCDCK